MLPESPVTPRAASSEDALRQQPVATFQPERLVQMLLGCVWLADGALQLQPYMFGRGFVTGVLMPNAQGNPSPIAGSITFMAHFLEPHITAWNALFAIIQIGIGVGLLVRRTIKSALALSFAWSLGVWWFGEGFGGLLSGTASPLSGAPGAVLLYVIIGVLVWPPRHAEDGAVGAGGGLLSERGARIVSALLWLGSAALLLQPSALDRAALHDSLVTAAAGQPRWYASLLLRTAHLVGANGLPLTLAFGAGMIVVGIAISCSKRTVPLLVLATILALFIWVFPEGLGGILTGQGTDPNTGPLLVLAVLAWYRYVPEKVPLRRLIVPAALEAAGS